MRRVVTSPSFYWTRVGRRRLRETIWGQSITRFAPPASRSAVARLLGRNRHVLWFSSQPNLATKDHLEHDLNRIEPVEKQPSPEKLQRRRKNAAKAVPYFLDNDVGCFEQTMNALNLDLALTDIKTRERTNGSGCGVLAEYRLLYQDSMLSFCEILMHDPSALSPEMEAVLDRLVDAGFADLQWAKHFRRFSKYNQDCRDYSNKLQTRTRKQQGRVANLEREKRLLAKMENDFATLQQELTVDEPEPPKTVVERMMNVVSFLWNPKDEQNKEENTIHNAKDFIFNRHNGRLKKQRRVVKNAQSAVDAVNKQIARLKAERDRYQPVLTSAEYEEANRIVQEVLRDISAAFATHIHQRHRRMIEQYQVLDAKTDLTKPHEWYLHARLDRRKIIFHGGPTNSGKTYAALQRLKTANSGLYLGPLRLLAAEVYETLTAQGVYTSLYTGQEQREVPFATHSAATVEMSPTKEDFDVVVIDEIQMIADPFRGFAWTRALLGIRCKEIHVCGGLEAENIVRRIAEQCGDELEIVRYDRFSELQVAENAISATPKTFGSYKTVQAGDCVVAFSRNDIFAIKREIERNTNHKCCVIYGSLPPETRTDQARLFNDPDSGYDILVASDAIGMGLNLNIRRIIFNSMFKTNGEAIVQLDHSHVKQISGRAGRRNSPFPIGEVTCRDPRDMDHLRKCMSENVAPIQKAGLLPTSEHIEHFSAALETYELGTDYDDLHRILVEFEDMAKTKGDFFICRQTPMRIVAKMLADLPIPIRDKYTLCMAPTTTNNKYSLQLLNKFAVKYARGEAPGLSGKLIPKPAKSFDDLSRLCSMHNELELFLWLSNKFPGNAVEKQTAQALKESVIEYINQGLSESEKLKLDHCYLKRDTKIRASWKKDKDTHGTLHDIDMFDDYVTPAEVDDI